ncbi:MAG: NACHT domain-containing protein [Planctomycetes bacterium]|nr:NACHT domain-containing protein [Planctomycetota bacterium]
MSKVDSKRGRQSVHKGRKFEDKVAALYRLLGYAVQQNIEICQKKVDILASFRRPGSRQNHRVIIECKDESRNTAQNQRVMQFKGLLDLTRQTGQADSAEIITRGSWSDQAKGFALSAGIELYTYEEKLRDIMDCNNYLERITYDFEHFHKCVAPDGSILKTPIIDIMSRSNLYSTYVPLMCRVVDHKKGVHLKPLDKYIEEWLADPNHNHLSVLGDFGTGKSSFCLHLTYKLAKRHLKDPVNTRIPLFISLRDYSKAVDLRQLITDLLLNKYNIRIENYAVFQRFLEDGHLILIFDGFDEMATKTDRALTMRNFDELTKAVVAGSKTILTCRTHYFTEQRHVYETLQSGEGSELLQAVRRRPNFQIVELEEFSDEQIKQLLSHYRPRDWQDAWIAIRRNLYDLARRPLLLDMIIATLPQLLVVDKAVNIVHLYDAYTKLWIEREDWHARMTPDGKQAFMEDLAMKMWVDRVQTIHYQDLKQPIRDYFKEEIITRDDLDYYDHDARTCSFLNRDSSGNYRFIHQSFMEFFVARRIFNSLRANSIDQSFRDKYFPPEICSFVAQFASEDVEALENLCRWAFDETQILAWNAMSVLPFLRDFRPEVVVEHLLRLCRNKRLKSGITWVFGELGVHNEKVLSLLRGALNDPIYPSPWWEAAFALEKLEAVEKPVDELIEHLPSGWTYDVAVKHLKKAIEATEKDGAHVDQRAVVAIIKENREENRPKVKLEETITKLFAPLNLSSDIIGRRSYYAVWLFGELRMLSMLSTLFAAANHPQAATRNMVAEALGKIWNVEKANRITGIDKDRFNVLRRLLKDTYYRTRIHAAEAIGKVHAISLLPDLKDAFEREPLRFVQKEILKSIRLLEGLIF